MMHTFQSDRYTQPGKIHRVAVMKIEGCDVMIKCQCKQIPTMTEVK